MKKRNIIITIAVLSAIFISLACVRIITGEDVWICEDGQWIKHGVPNDPMPTKSCDKNENENVEKTEIFENKESEFSRIADSCKEEEQGRFLSMFRECEYASESWCNENSGEFNMCASPCRNDPDRAREDSQCTETCIPVCKFNNL